MTFLVIFSLVAGLLLVYFIIRCHSAGTKAIALSAYASQLGLNDTARLHNWALVALIDMHTHPYGRALITDQQYYIFHLEAVVALRDRFDQLTGKENGAENKVSVRMELTSATQSLKQMSHWDRHNLKMKFKTTDDFATEEVEELSLHLTKMKQVFFGS